MSIICILKVSESILVSIDDLDLIWFRGQRSTDFRWNRLSSPRPKSNNSKNINYWWYWIYVILVCISWTSAGFIWNPSKSIVCRDLSTFGKFLWILGCWIYDADFCWFRLKSTQTNTQGVWPAHLTLLESRPSDLLANLLYHDFRKISDETGGNQGHEIETMSSTDVHIFCNVGVLIWGAPNSN